MAALDRDQVVAMLATFGDRTPGAVPDQISSLELTWLIAQIEQEYGIVLDFSDDALAAMSTVSGATTALGTAVAEAQERARQQRQAPRHEQAQAEAEAPRG